MSAPPSSVISELASAAFWEAEKATGQFGLPFRRDTWRGQAGNWAGSGIGSSIDFQDHRQYVPGDDPRYINWQAYARSGHYSMKLYREEVSPRVDLVLDASPSMTYEKTKAARGLELFFFAALSTLKTNAQLHAYVLEGENARLVTAEEIRAARLPDPNETHEALRVPAFDRVPWRPQALRVVVSDLLFPGEPESIGQRLVAGKSHALLLAPWLEAEANPPWLGNCELVECEGGRCFPRNFSEDDLERYRQRYRSHFAAWREGCHRLTITLARVSCAPAFPDALMTEALPSQAVELINA